MTVRLRIKYERAYRCGCGREMARISERCIACAISEEQKDAAKIKAALRARLDPGPSDDYGESGSCMTAEHSATEAARIVADSETAPESWVTYVHQLRREAAEIVGRNAWERAER